MTKTKKRHVIITAAVMMFIFIHSAMPGNVSGAESGYIVRIIASITGMNPGVLSFAVRKAAHFTEFAVLGACFAVNAGGFRLSSSAGEIWLAAWLAASFYAFTDEFHQMFVQGRSCSLKDVCIDSAGAALGAIIAAAVQRRMREDA